MFYVYWLLQHTQLRSSYTRFCRNYILFSWKESLLCWALKTMFTCSCRVMHLFTHNLWQSTVCSLARVKFQCRSHIYEIFIINWCAGDVGHFNQRQQQLEPAINRRPACFQHWSLLTKRGIKVSVRDLLELNKSGCIANREKDQKTNWLSKSNLIPAGIIS